MVGKTWVPALSSIAHSHKYSSSSSSILLIAAAAAAADSLLQLLPTERFRLSLPLFLAGPVAAFKVPGICEDCSLGLGVCVGCVVWVQEMHWEYLSLDGGLSL